MPTSPEQPISLRLVPLTLYTEQLVVRGLILTHHHRVTDILRTTDPFLVLQDVTLEEYGEAGPAVAAEYAQVNLASVLFAASLTTVAPITGLRTPKIAARALVSVPPFRIVGQVHLLPAMTLRDSLAALQGSFIPITDATFWSERLGEERRTVAFVAVNQSRAQVFAPFREVDPADGDERRPDSAGWGDALAGSPPHAVADEPPDAISDEARDPPPSESADETADEPPPAG